MLFGNRDDFAIEAMVEEHLDPPSAVWGRMRIWVGGHSFGDYDDPHCTLYPAYSKFKELINNLNSLHNIELLSLAVEECYLRVNEALYGKYVDDELVESEYEKFADKYWKHDFLTNWGEMFDRTEKPFIFRSDSDTLMVLQPDVWSKEIKQYYCNIKSFCNTVNEFLVWHETETARLTKNGA